MISFAQNERLCSKWSMSLNSAFTLKEEIVIIMFFIQKRIKEFSKISVLLKCVSLLIMSESVKMSLENKFPSNKFALNKVGYKTIYGSAGQ